MRAGLKQASAEIGADAQPCRAARKRCVILLHALQRRRLLRAHDAGATCNGFQFFRMLESYLVAARVSRPERLRTEPISTGAPCAFAR